jgi:predicted amidophosphoribosyltransferase
MQHCPTCNANLKDAPICRRCGTDLTKARQAADQAEQHFQAAVRAYAQKRPEVMLHHARRCFALRRSPKSVRLLACAALLRAEYPLAMNTWAKLNPDDHPQAATPPRADEVDAPNEKI